MADSTIDPQIRLGELVSPAAEQPLPGVRAWFALLLAWLAGLTALALLMLARYDQGDEVALIGWLLALMCFYLSLCNSLVPLPTAWIILLAASPEVGPAAPGWLRVLAVAGLGALSTVAANLTEYHGLALLFSHRLGRRIRRSGVYRWTLRWFDAAPFQVLTLVGFLPIPVDALRWVAILRRYPRLRFALAYFVGRGARYALLAYLSILLHLSAGQILAIQIALVAAAIVGRWLWPRMAGRLGPAAVPQGHLDPPAETPARP